MPHLGLIALLRQRNDGIGSIRWREADGGEIGGQKVGENGLSVQKGVVERFGTAVAAAD